jgi:hypothetical protein
MFCRLKDCRRLATRNDRLAANFLGSIYLAAAIMWWLSVSALVADAFLLAEHRSVKALASKILPN